MLLTLTLSSPINIMVLFMDFPAILKPYIKDKTFIIGRTNKRLQTKIFVPQNY